MDDERIAQLKDFYARGLLEDTIPFWLQHGIDAEYGGYLTALDRDGSVIDTDKSVWHQGRFAWTLGELYNNVEPKQEWLECALSGICFLENHCFDASDGRMYFHVSREGNPIRKRRYAISESFAAIAYGEVAKATNDRELADRAVELFQSFLNHQPAPKFTNHRPTKGIGGPMIAIGTAQELRESIGYAEADQIIDDAIETIRGDHMKPEHRVVMETVGEDGQILDHFDGRLLNPGHAIEAAWFVLREADHRNGDERLINIGVQILDWMWEWGWDTEFGGILYFRDLFHKPPQEYWHDMKFWWPHNEAIIATLYAYLLTKEQRFADWHRLVHDWSYQHFADQEQGEWFGYLHRDGRLSHSAKGNLWKGPFHLPRMQLVCWKLLERDW